MSTRPTITAAMKLEVVWREGGVIQCSVCRCTFLICDMQYDHHLAVINGGKHNAENLRPICRDCHKIKSAQEHINNCKSKRIAKKHRGERHSKRPMPKSKGFDKTLTKRFDGQVVRRES